MSDSQAVRLHNGDKSLKKTKKGEVVSKARSTLAKKKDSPLALWRKVCKEYLKKGGFVTLPKKGTKEHKAMRTMYDKEREKAGLV
tara:strand:+ start:233 stop:487 length:255 start_codon:yes stop_codon:yes gene_type:complete